jgi:hypothetical protein
VVVVVVAAAAAVVVRTGEGLLLHSGDKSGARAPCVYILWAMTMCPCTLLHCSVPDGRPSLWTRSPAGGGGGTTVTEDVSL